jgi:hypothetical protein
MTTTPAVKKTGQLTAYKVLKQTRKAARPGEDGTPVAGRELEAWEVVASINARSAEAAIRAHIDKASDGADGTYAAVSARSFRPVVVKVETARVVKLGDRT